MSGPVETWRQDDLVVARLEGEIDIANVGRIATRLSEAVSNAARGIVVDLSGVRYIDSAGVRMLFEVLRELERCRQGMALVIPEDSPIRRLVEITRLNDALPVCVSIDDCSDRLRATLDERF